MAEGNVKWFSEKRGIWFHHWGGGWEWSGWRL